MSHPCPLYSHIVSDSCSPVTPPTFIPSQNREDDCGLSGQPASGVAGEALCTLHPCASSSGQRHEGKTRSSGSVWFLLLSNMPKPGRCSVPLKTPRPHGTGSGWGPILAESQLCPCSCLCPQPERCGASWRERAPVGRSGPVWPLPRIPSALIASLST